MFLSGISIFCYSIIIRRKIITTCLQHVTTLKKPNGKSVFTSKCITLIHVIVQFVVHKSLIGCIPQSWLKMAENLAETWQQRGQSIFFHPPSHKVRFLVLPVFSLLLSNIVSPVRACLIIWWERFRGTQKEDDRGPLGIQSSVPGNPLKLSHCIEKVEGLEAKQFVMTSTYYTVQKVYISLPLNC